MNKDYEPNMLSSYYIPYDDNCNECDHYTTITCCNKCGEGVCTAQKCCTSYPHYNNTSFIICRSCFCEIERQLHVQIDYNKLRILKQRIKNDNIIRRTIKQPHI